MVIANYHANLESWLIGWLTDKSFCLGWVVVFFC